MANACEDRIVLGTDVNVGEVRIWMFTLTAAEVAEVLGARGIAREDEYARPIFDNIPRRIECRERELERGTDRTNIPDWRI